MAQSQTSLKSAWRVTDQVDTLQSIAHLQLSTYRVSQQLCYNIYADMYIKQRAKSPNRIQLSHERSTSLPYPPPLQLPLAPPGCATRMTSSALKAATRSAMDNGCFSWFSVWVWVLVSPFGFFFFGLFSEVFGLIALPSLPELSVCLAASCCCCSIREQSIGCFMRVNSTRSSRLPLLPHCGAANDTEIE